jgi:hypothetical protein
MVAERLQISICKRNSMKKNDDRDRRCKLTSAREDEFELGAITGEGSCDSQLV